MSNENGQALYDDNTYNWICPRCTDGYALVSSAVDCCGDSDMYSSFYKVKVNGFFKYACKACYALHDFASLAIHCYTVDTADREQEPECNACFAPAYCGNCGTSGNYCTSCCPCQREEDDCDDEDFSGLPSAIKDRLGLQPHRPLAQNCADFYLLQYMDTVLKHVPAKRMLTRFANELAPEFAAYLDIACGGELRHAHLGWVPELQEETVMKELNYITFPEGLSRNGTWAAWTEVETPETRAKFAMKVYFSGCYKDPEGRWQRGNGSCDIWPSGGYGGPMWGMCAEALHNYLTGKMTKVLFLDRCWNLQHNGGPVFDKVYRNMSGLQNVLAAHGHDDFELLLHHASEQVKRIWNSINRVEGALNHYYNHGYISNEYLRGAGGYKGDTYEHRKSIAKSSLDFVALTEKVGQNPTGTYWQRWLATDGD